MHCLDGLINSHREDESLRNGVGVISRVWTILLLNNMYAQKAALTALVQLSGYKVKHLGVLLYFMVSQGRDNTLLYLLDHKVLTFNLLQT